MLKKFGLDQAKESKASEYCMRQVEFNDAEFNTTIMQFDEDEVSFELHSICY